MIFADLTEHNEPKQSSVAQLEGEIAFWGPAGDPLDIFGPFWGL